LEWNAAKLRFSEREANSYIGHQYRAGWTNKALA
jgi:hypothetical protein